MAPSLEAIVPASEGEEREKRAQSHGLFRLFFRFLEMVSHTRSFPSDFCLLLLPHALSFRESRRRCDAAGEKNTTGAAMVMGTREKDLKGGEAIESSRGSGRLHTARSTGGDEGEKKNMTEKLNKRARSRPSTHAAENKTGVSCRDERE